jgi:hypothetical protein
MERIKLFIRRQPTYALVIVAITLLLIAFFSPRYIGVIPGILAMAAWFIVLGRAVGKSQERHPEIERPWWTNL